MPFNAPGLLSCPSNVEMLLLGWACLLLVLAAICTSRTKIWFAIGELRKIKAELDIKKMTDELSSLRKERMELEAAIERSQEKIRKGEV